MNKKKARYIITTAALAGLNNMNHNDMTDALKRFADAMSAAAETIALFNSVHVTVNTVIAFFTSKRRTRVRKTLVSAYLLIHTLPYEYISSIPPPRQNVNTFLWTLENVQQITIVLSILGKIMRGGICSA